MIFVTVGSMFPFDRLIRAVDQWATQRNFNDITMQIGAGSYLPQNGKWIRSLSPDDFASAVKRCDLMVTHLGMGSVISAMQARKPIILLPRRAALGEANSDHQIHGTEWLRGSSGVWIADDEKDIEEFLMSFIGGKLTQVTNEVSQYASIELIEKVKNFVNSI